MKISFFSFCPILRRRAAFSLVEVVLALGIFLVTVLALVGLLGPTLKSINEVEKVDEISSVVNTVNGFLQNSPGIAQQGESKFDVVYTAVESDDYATLFVFREYLEASATAGDNDVAAVKMTVGFSQNEQFFGANPGNEARLSDGDLQNAAGTIYRVILTPSSVIPESHRSSSRDNASNTYTLESNLSNYDEGYFAMEVRIFDQSPDPNIGAGDINRPLEDFTDVEPLFTYNTAVVR